jgi:hypothetical protein
MRKITLLLLICMNQAAVAGQEEKPRHEINQWNEFQARYKIHSGGAAYSEPPTKADGVITVAFRDEAAKQLFDQIGPDVKDTCSSDQGDRERRRKGAYCTYTARLHNPANAHYRCWIGIDLRTGEGDVRVSC